MPHNQVAPMISILPALPTTHRRRETTFEGTATTAVAGRRMNLRRQTTRVRVVGPSDDNAPPQSPASSPRDRLSRAAHSVISMKRKQLGVGGIRCNEHGDIGATSGADPWTAVLHKVLNRVAVRARLAPPGSRATLRNVLHSRSVKHLIKEAVVTKHWKDTALAPDDGHGPSSVMEDWIKTTRLRAESALSGDVEAAIAADGAADEDNETDAKVQSAFDVGSTRVSTPFRGRALLLEESCRRALAQPGENRTEMDLQALKAWFQMTKLKITTDFEQLQPAELDLLCRRMTLVFFHRGEIVFRQGEEGDAMYIVLSGAIEVRVWQRVLGEKVEVTVCELGKGDYFGERALLNNDLRAATIVSKSDSEIVKITRDDYNMLLKKDQLAFLARLQLTSGILDRKSRQQTPHEYFRVLSKAPRTRSKADLELLCEYLQTLKFFRGLPVTFVRELCAVVDCISLPANACVFQEGDIGDNFYVVFSGSVDVIVNAQDARGQTQQTKLIALTEGAHFGELALMRGHGLRSATVMTREPCRLLVLGAQDYNSTLRRIQKDDLAKRVHALDQMCMFQTPEWTSDLLRELSYVLSEQQWPSGSVLFRQGDKATQIFFVVRGEVVVTMDMTDAKTSSVTNVVVERIGRFRAVGEDAALGANFNEVILRQVTVTTSTPVQVLVLSKYDVFHRLSHAARETLRLAARTQVERLVYCDRYQKTVTWDAYKRRLLQERFPLQARESTTTPRATVLVNANDFLLLEPESVAVAKEFSAKSTLGQYVARFNPDAEPNPELRARQWRDCMSAEDQRCEQVLREGNPLAYLDVASITKQQESESRLRGTSVRRLIPPADIATRTSSAMNVTDEASSASAKVTKPETAATSTAASMLATNPTFFQENFIFSPVRDPQRRSSPRRELQLPDPCAKSSDEDAAMSVCQGDHIVISVLLNESEERKGVLRSPTFRIVRAVRTLDQAPQVAREAQRSARFNATQRELIAGVDPVAAADYFTLPLKKFALLPRACRSRESEDTQQCKLIERIAGMPTPSALWKSSSGASSPLATASLKSTRRASVISTDSSATTTTSVQPTARTDGLAVFGSFDKLALGDAQPCDGNASPPRQPNLPSNSSAPSPMLRRASSRASPRKSMTSSGLTAARPFAVVGILLSKLEQDTAFCDEPLLCVYKLCPSESEAMDSAMLVPRPPWDNTLLCVLPALEWISIADAYEWCVHIHIDRHGKPSLSPRGRRGSMAMANANASARSNQEPSDLSVEPEWMQAQQKAHRLHQFICARMGVKRQDTDPQRAVAGFSVRSPVTVADKLAALETYLDNASHVPAASSKGSSLLGRYHQIRRFGSIMKGRISALAPSPPSTAASSTRSRNSVGEHRASGATAQ